jgi:hypothetical protein
MAHWHKGSEDFILMILSYETDFAVFAAFLKGNNQMNPRTTISKRNA